MDASDLVSRPFSPQKAMQALFGHEDDEDLECLVTQLAERDDFHRSRIRCITHPLVALETLKPYAELHLRIVCAQNLVPRPAWAGTAVCDPYVAVFLDDARLEGRGMKTLTIRGTMHPLWQHDVSVGLVSPLSMVRLQVFDDRVTHEHEAAGFVEFCAGDIPYDTEISGWLELRFQDQLKSTSLKRYASHSTLREEELWQHAAMKRAAEDGGNAKPKLRSKVTVDLSPEDFKARKQVSERAIAKTRTILQGCSHTCSGASKVSDVDRGNAGELFVTMKLTRVVSNSDATFALALDQPKPKVFDEYVVEKDDDEVVVRKALDLHKCQDTYDDVRLLLWEDFVCCILYWFKYVGHWRSPAISFVVTALSFSMCIHSYYWAIVLPFVAALVHLLNGWESLRYAWSRGGRNAMLDDDGFRLVARWKSTVEMMYFIKRVVQHDLQGQVADEVKLRTLASTCFRDGLPTISYDQLTALLKRETDMCTVDSSMDAAHLLTAFSRHDRVMVDQRNRATVEGPAANGKVFVVYDDSLDSVPPDPPAAGEASATSARPVQQATPQRVGVAVEVWRLRRRPTAVSEKVTWVLPTWFTTSVMKAMEQLEKVRRANVYPLILRLSDIATWRRKFQAFCVFTCCILVSATLALIEALYEESMSQQLLRCSGADAHQRAAWVVITLMRSLDNLVLGVIFFLLFVVNAQWFVSVKSVLKICARFGADKARHAPENWAFFRKDDAFQQSLARLVGPSQPRGLGGLGGMELPDLAGWQQRISNIRGLSQFKLPDSMQ